MPELHRASTTRLPESRECWPLQFWEVYWSRPLIHTWSVVSQKCSYSRISLRSFAQEKASCAEWNHPKAWTQIQLWGSKKWSPQVLFSDSAWFCFVVPGYQLGASRWP